MSDIQTAPNSTSVADIQTAPNSTSVAAKFSRVLSLYGGLFMIVFSAFIFYGVYKYVSLRTPTDFSLYESGILIAVIGVSLILVVLGARIIMSAGSAPRIVIPAEDRRLLENLITNKNEEGIYQYIRLSSLSGATGVAQQLGLTGLPLATVGLTIFFSVFAVFGFDGFLDLAKLTLGAFIGSFVQRANLTGEGTGSLMGRPQSTNGSSKSSDKGQ